MAYSGSCNHYYVKLAIRIYALIDIVNGGFMIGFVFFVGLRLAEYLVVCTLCLVYVRVGPGGEYVGNILDVMVDQFLKIDWMLICNTIEENVLAILKKVGE